MFLVICILEGSGKWPDSIDAIRRLKAAYYLSLSKALSKTAPNVLSTAYTDYLEVYKVRSNIVSVYRVCSKIVSVYNVHSTVKYCQSTRCAVK